MQLLLFVLPVLMFSHPFPGFLNRISCSPVFFLMISWPWHAMTLGIHGVPMAFSQVMSRAMPTETGALPVATGISRGGFKVTKLGLIYRGDPPVNKWIYNGILVGHTYMYIYTLYTYIYVYIYMYMYVYIYTCTRMCWIIGIHHELLVLPSSKWT